jgi:outer membrane protein assembly factor BamB
MSRRPIVSATLLIILTISSTAGAADWPRWLGPDQNGASPEKGVFGDAEPKLSVAWSRPLGIAYSAIAIVDDKAVTMFADGETDWLTAMDVETGEEIWRYRIDGMFPKVGGAHGGQLSTPVIDKGVVYGLGAKGQLFAVSLEDGSEIWQVRIDEKLGARQPYFGFTTSPLVVGKLLFVQTGGADGHSLTALDKKTGKSRWSIGDDKVGYQSPILTKLGGREQIVAVTNQTVLGLVPKDGTVLWSQEHGLVAERDGWATPILIGDDSFVLTGGSESVAYEIGAADDTFGAKELWRSQSLKGNYAMPVVHEGHLYGYNGDFLACVSAATGEQAWKYRSDAAGLILVDDHLVIFDSQGEVIVAEPSPKGYNEKAKVRVSDKGGFTFPSFADGGIFVRNLESIARVNVQ